MLRINVLVQIPQRHMLFFFVVEPHLQSDKFSVYLNFLRYDINAKEKRYHLCRFNILPWQIASSGERNSVCLGSAWCGGEITEQVERFELRCSGQQQLLKSRGRL